MIYTNSMVRKSSQPTVMNSVTTSPVIVQGEERKEILEQRKLLIDLQNQSSQSFDKMLVTLSGGALTLSITFIRQTVPEALPGTTTSLALAWLFLLLSLLASLFSLFTSQYGLMKACDDLDREYLGVIQVQSPKTNLLIQVCKRAGGKFSSIVADRMTTHWLNIASIIFCVVGVGLLALFVVLNFSQLVVPLSK